jgi:CheY-like chemotaxis protein
MFFKEWEILLVDDEPDVLTVSKLAMKNFKVHGLPLKIHTAGSKAEAIEFLRSKPEPLWIGLPVVFVDVVMESETAGLELCQYIREDMGNKLIHIFIRTGQPGIAPEREVIDRYHINGYYTKLEATEYKLYSLVKSSVRQYLWSRTSLESGHLFDAIIAASGSRERIAAGVKRTLEKFQTAVPPALPTNNDIFACLMIGDRIISSMGLEEDAARDLRDKLDQLPGMPLDPNGDKHVKDESGNQMLKVAAQPSKAELYWLFKLAFTPPDYIITMVYNFLTGLATIWQQAR